MISPLFFFFNKENKTDYIHRKDKEKYAPNTDNFDGFFFAPVFFLLSTMNVIDVKRHVFSETHFLPSDSLQPVRGPLF